MSPVEIGIITLCGIVGWFVVSFVMRHVQGAPESLDDKPWYDVLGVPERVDIETVERAYADKLKRLSDSQPRIMTDAEQRTAYRHTQQLQAALAEARSTLTRDDDSPTG